MKVCLQCMGCYVNGRYSHKWLNADELEEAYEKLDVPIEDHPTWVEPILSLSQQVCKDVACFSDEWMIADYDGISLGSEHPHIPTLIGVMRFYGDTNGGTAAEAAIRLYWDNSTNPLSSEETRDAITEVWHHLQEVDVGWDATKADWGMEQAESMGLISSDHPLYSYIDFEQYADALLHDYYTIKVDYHTFAIDYGTLSELIA